MKKMNHLLGLAGILVVIAAIAGIKFASTPINKPLVIPIPTQEMVASSSATPTMLPTVTFTPTPTATPTPAFLHYGGKLYMEITPTGTTTR